MKFKSPRLKGLILIALLPLLSGFQCASGSEHARTSLKMEEPGCCPEHVDFD